MNRFILMTAVLLTATLWATAQSTTAQKFKATYQNTNPTDEMRIFAYIADPDSSGTNIRRIPGGEVIHTLRFEEIDEKAYSVKVLEAWNGWFRIDPQIEELTTEEGMVVLDGKEAWIHGSLLANDLKADGLETFDIAEDSGVPSVEGWFAFVSLGKSTTLKPFSDGSTNIVYDRGEGENTRTGKHYGPYSDTQELVLK